MKKLLLLAVIGAILLNGCVAPTYRSSSLVAVELNPEISSLPVIADLNVLPEKARGEARGTTAEIPVLKQMAITNALGQNPPSVDAADVLVGTNFFYEVQGHLARVIAMGYPAFYTNFRTAAEEDSVFLIVRKPERNTLLLQQQSSSGGAQFYLSAKYQLIGGAGGATLGGNLEMGYLNRGFFSADFGIGGGYRAFDLGGGFSFGGRIKPVNWFQIIPGGSAGFWWIERREDIFTGWGYEYNYNNRFAFGGPFVKLLFGRNKCWGEVSQRLLFGTTIVSQTMAGFTLTL